MKAYINNTAYEFQQGETILDFVRRIKANKEAIPTMCQDDRLENCRSSGCAFSSILSDDQ